MITLELVKNIEWLNYFIILKCHNSIKVVLRKISHTLLRKLKHFIQTTTIASWINIMLIEKLVRHHKTLCTYVIGCLDYIQSYQQDQSLNQVTLVMSHMSRSLIFLTKMLRTSIKNIFVDSKHEHIFERISKNSTKNVVNGLKVLKALGLDNYKYDIIEDHGLTYLKREISTNFEKTSDAMLSAVKYIIKTKSNPIDHIYLDGDGKAFSLFVDCNILNRSKNNIVYYIDPDTKKKLIDMFSDANIANILLLERLLY